MDKNGKPLTGAALDARKEKLEREKEKKLDEKIDEKVEQCLKQLDSKFNTQGTIVCLSIMRKIRDATFNKAISPLKRIYLYGIQYIFFVYGVRIC